jgi:hypothetical protein
MYTVVNQYMAGCTSEADLRVSEEGNQTDHQRDQQHSYSHFSHGLPPSPQRSNLDCWVANVEKGYFIAGHLRGKD